MPDDGNIIDMTAAFEAKQRLNYARHEIALNPPMVLCDVGLGPMTFSQWVLEQMHQGKLDHEG